MRRPARLIRDLQEGDPLAIYDLALAVVGTEIRMPGKPKVGDRDNREWRRMWPRTAWMAGEGGVALE